MSTAVPKTYHLQSEFAELAATFLGYDEKHKDILQRIASSTRIHKRHLSVKDHLHHWQESQSKAPFLSTKKRNALFKAHAPQLTLKVARDALIQWGRPPEEITHVISISCTGMMAPGLEFLIMDELHLNRSVDRLGINFMGCFGAFKGLSVASALAKQNPKHRILVVCTELCSLHFQSDLKMDTLIGNSLFSDGAAAVIVGMDPQKPETSLFNIIETKSSALPNSLETMTWDTGDEGYVMRLSVEVPIHVEKHIKSFCENILPKNTSMSHCEWAIHPGGKAIVEGIARACQLNEKQQVASWNVLRDYGNMSSPTFLFVLEELLKQTPSSKSVIGLGFGPGLSIEGILLECGKTHAPKN